MAQPRQLRRSWASAILGVSAVFVVALGVSTATRAEVGATLRDAATASPDFQLTIDPPSQQLPPGSSVSFVVGIAAIDGFSEPVTLSVSDLPTGVTGVFSVNPLAPSGTSFLTLTAAANAPTGTFSFTVSGTAGAITHHATRQVTVDFGLIPICYGAVEGTVTDADTGLPLPGVTVALGPGTTTDASGHYLVEKLGLGENNSPAEYVFEAGKKPDYWFAVKTFVAICNEKKQLDFALVPVKPARVSGRVVEGNANPNDYDTPIPTSKPIEGANVSIPNYFGPGLFWPAVPAPNPDTTGADGLYDITLPLGYNNEPLEVGLYAYTEPHESHENYWWRTVSVGRVEPEQHVVQEIALVKKCTGSISGLVLDADTHLPVADAVVSALEPRPWGLAVIEVRSDAEGRFTFPDLLLGHNNRPRDVLVGADKAGYSSGGTGYTTTSFETCGDHREVTLYPMPLEPNKFGAIEGHVFDEETGAPVEGVQVSGFSCPCDTTDADGYYRLEPINLGSLDQVPVTLFTGKSGYWDESASAEVRANQTATLNIRILRVRFARISGVVRDAITKAPIANASVGELGGVGDTTDVEGRYAIEGVSLGYRNAPRDASLRARADGYWLKDATVPVRADETSTQDIELVRICKDATITGKVVNAFTQEPIPNASVSGGGVQALTDVNGNYRLEHVTVGTDNSPLEVSLTAFHPDFYTQTKRITVFCAAVITVDFGRPPSTAAVEGYVTNLVTNTPIVDAFVGSEFGVADRTDENGYYRLPNAPLNPDGSDRTWQITATPDGFEPQTKPVTVRANATSRLDFGFGGPSSGAIIVEKQTNPDGATGNFTFTGDAAGTISDNGQIVVANLAPGTYSSTENNPTPSFDLTSIVCDDGASPTASTRNLGTRTATFKLDPGETVKCTFTNTQRGRAKVIKTVSGALPSGTQSFTFQLRSGASTTQAGTILESGTASAANGGVINFTTLLVPETTYALCETVMPGWMTTLGPPFYVVYNPSGDNSTVCTDFTVNPGETKEFAIDNKPPPGGLARTIGFWKNWASCAQSSGKQKPVLDQTLTAAEQAGVQIGDLVLHAGECLKAVRILNKSTINDGTKKSSDPAFNLAAQLLAAKLNAVAGAGTCPAVVTAMNSAQALLDAINFNGITHTTMTAGQKSQANSLATTLDRYNNNLLC